MDENLGSFQFGANINRAAMNIHVQALRLMDLIKRWLQRKTFDIVFCTQGHTDTYALRTYPTKQENSQGIKKS